MNKAKSLLLVLVIGTSSAVSGCVGNTADALLNTTYVDHNAPRPNPAEQALHLDLFVVDLHGDTMMWDRDLLERSDYGHIDLPRLIEGNVGLQVFSIATRTPYGLTSMFGSCNHPDGFNAVRLLHGQQSDQMTAWGNAEAEFMRQVTRLKSFIEESNDRHEADPLDPYLMLITNAGDFALLIQRRVHERKPVVGVILALEGAHWIGTEGMSDNVIRAKTRDLYDAEIRMVGATHRYDNALGYSSEGCHDDTVVPDNPEGRAVFYQEAEELGMILDLSHSGTIEQDFDGSRIREPFVLSHIGFQEFCIDHDERCNEPRNLTDQTLRSIGEHGGLMGVGFWPQAVGENVESIVGAFNHAYRALQGVVVDPADHLAIGSDFDGSIEAPFDASGHGVLTAALLRNDAEGALPNDETTIRKVAGVNACFMLATQLPGGSPEKAQEICTPLLGEGNRQ
jgi:membrane dipeptidase